MSTAPKTPPSAREVAFARAIDVARENKEMSQMVLADRAGISQPQLSRIFSGKKPVTLTELLALMDAVDLNLEDVSREVDAVAYDDVPAPMRPVVRRVEARSTRPQRPRV